MKLLIGWVLTVAVLTLIAALFFIFIAEVPVDEGVASFCYFGILIISALFFKVIRKGLNDTIDKVMDGNSDDVGYW